MKEPGELGTMIVSLTYVAVFAFGLIAGYALHKSSFNAGMAANAAVYEMQCDRANEIETMQWREL